MKFSFFYKGKKHIFDVKVCDNPLKKMLGLMFRKNSKPLLFIFNKPTREPIHSFFCIEFIAVWFYDDKIIDIKFVQPWKLSVRPKEKFNKLLEIPKSSKSFYEFPSVNKSRR